MSRLVTITTGRPGPTGPAGADGIDALPPDVVLIDAYTALPAEVVNAGTSATGWGSTNHSTAFAYDATKGAVLVILRAGVSNAALTAEAHYNLTEPLDVSDRAAVELDVMFDMNQVDTDMAQRLEFVACAGANLSGTAAVGTWAGGNENEWFHVIIPLDELTSIQSVGMRTVSAGSTVSDTTRFWFRNVQLGAVSEVQAAQLAGKTPFVSEGDTVSAGGTWDGRTTSPRLDIRFHHAVHPGLHGWRDLREWQIDETGTVDVTSQLAWILNSLAPGEKLMFPHEAKFLVHGSVVLGGLDNLEVDFNGSVIYDDAYRIPAVNTINDFIQLSNCRDIKLRNGLIVAAKFGDTNSSIAPGTASATFITTIAGSPTTSGATKLLDAQDEGIRIQPFNGSDYSYLGRHYDLTLGLVNKLSVILSDSAQVASDCRIRMTDADGYVIAESTLTLTGTPTEYALVGAPNDLSKLVRLEVVKMTATTNTITVSTVKCWGRTAYSTASEFTSGITIGSGNQRIEVADFHIEGVGGYGFNVQGSVTSPPTDITARRVVTRATHTQGLTVNLARRVELIDCKSWESARSAFDIEPYAATWFVEGVKMKNCEARNPINYGLAATAWAQITNLEVDGFTVEGAGVGAWIGGARGATISNILVRSGSDIVVFTGQDMMIDGVVAQYPPSVTSGTADGPDATSYTAGGNIIKSYTAQLDSLSATRAPDFLDGTTLIGPGAGVKAHGGSTVTGGSGGNGAAQVTGRPPMLAFIPGTHRQRLPNTYRGAATDGLWFPWGMDAVEGVTAALGVSGTSTPAVNLRGIAQAVTESATDIDIFFPSKGFAGTFGSVGSISSGTTTGGTLVPTTTYYYSYCARPHWRRSHKAAMATTRSATISAEHNSVTNIGVTDWQDLTNGYHLAGLTVYRGTTGASGPWDTRFDVVPDTPWYSLRSDFTVFTDLGDTLVWPSAPASDRNWGYPNMTSLGVAATAQSGEWATIVDETGWEPDTSYAIQVTPSWGTTVWVTAKAKGGFTINFGTAAPADATVDWFLVR